jgi:hypothetical protein
MAILAFLAADVQLVRRQELHAVRGRVERGYRSNFGLACQPEGIRKRASKCRQSQLAMAESPSFRSYCIRLTPARIAPGADESR